MNLKDPRIRKILFQSVLVKRGIQGNYTPPKIADKLIEAMGDQSDKTIMVLFNLELLEALQRKGFLEKNKVIFISDNKLEMKFARAIYKVQTLMYDNSEAWQENLSKTVEDIMTQMKKAPDITLTNPPYNKSLDLKILLALEEKKLLKKVICVHPATWLVDNKGTKTLFKDFRNTFDRHTSSLEVFNGNPVFDIKLFVPCVITQMDLNALYKTKSVSWFGENGWAVTSFDDVTMHGRNWDPLVKEFHTRVSAYCLKYGTVKDHLINISAVDVKKYQVQLAAIRGHTDTCKMFKDDMYTLIQSEAENNKGIRKSTESKTILQVNLKKEQDSLLNYLQTDFIRLCLSLLKINQNIARGELALVPWMDFTRSWTDDDLFSELKYNRGHAIREYAKTFLPDYHNLYPTGKTY